MRKVKKMMERKNKYVSPKTMVLHLQTACLLAGSGRSSGGASGGSGENQETGPNRPITTPTYPQPGGGATVESKGSSFNAWETWEEY